MMPMMIDLFSGTGSASEPMKDAGWAVVRVELDPRFAPDVVADVLDFEWGGATSRSPVGLAAVYRFCSRVDALVSHRKGA